MRTGLWLGAMAIAMSTTATGAMAQDDDWEFQQDTTRGITVAAARYDAGQMIVVQCRDNKLTAVFTGLPQSTEPLRLTAARADGRTISQTFLSAGAPGAWRVAGSGRGARFLRGGGLYSIRTLPGATPTVTAAFDLPTQSTGLDRVLTACGWAVADDRDLLVDADVSLTDPATASPRRYVPTRRGATSRAPRREIPTESLPRPVIADEDQVSCIVHNLQLRECRADHPASAQSPAILATIRDRDGDQVFPVNGTDAAANEGRVIRLSGGRLTIVDYVATTRAD